jgi:biotin transport system permease protein
VTFRYEPGRSLAHRLDPRSKLLVQAGFAAATFAHTTPTGLAALTVVTAAVLVGARTSPLSVMSDVWVLFPFLVGGPLLQGATVSPPYFSVAQARFPALVSYRVVLLLAVSAAYVRTTPARESRAAVQRLVPGRVGRFLGVGVGFVFRFLPVLRDDLGRIRDAMRARLGGERPVHERMRLATVAGLDRAFRRSDTLALALRARCFAWNPTLPELRMGVRDLPAVAMALALTAWAVAPLLPL